MIRVPLRRGQWHHRRRSARVPGVLNVAAEPAFGRWYLLRIEEGTSWAS